MTKPIICALDIETSALEPFKPGAEIVSIAYAWYKPDGTIGTIFERGEENIRKSLQRLMDNGNPVLVYNQQFEQAWFQTKFPEIKLNWYCDVMRLVQNLGSSYDAGTMKFEIQGVGLKTAVQRILGETEPWTEEIYAWIRHTYKVNKGQEGQYLASAPDELLKPYNEADSVYTLKLYTEITRYFKECKFDWESDHKTYLFIVDQLVESYLRGYPLDRADLQDYIGDIQTEVDGIDLQFRAKYKKEILAVRESLRLKEQAKFKKKVVEVLPEFNAGSRHHLAALFIGQLGCTPKHFSPKGAPSFKSAHIGTYGEGGKMLETRQKRLIIQKQAMAALRVSEPTGRLHVSLKAAGTSTFRFAGSSGLNIQGISRKDRRLMEAFQTYPNETLVEIDAASGEATIISALTNDKMYKYFSFDGKGVAPYYEGNQLMISDPYLAFQSVSGVGSAELKEAFLHRTYNGNTFAQQWLIDDEVIKKDLKKTRQVSKMVVLALGYGAKGKKIAQSCREMFGIQLTDEQGNEIYKTYWSLFKDVKQFADKCQFRVKQSGYLVNPWGCRLTPEPRRAFNATIQSSMSSIVNWKLMILKDLAPWANFYTCIHDALLFSVPTERLEEFKVLSKESDKIMNSQLGWSVDVGFGFTFGKNLYETK